MSQIKCPIDIVGSFLPPESILTTQNEYKTGKIDKHNLSQAINKAISQLVEHEIAAGLKEITSGELSRNYWNKDFWFGLEGIRLERINEGHVFTSFDTFTDHLRFTGRIDYNPNHPFFDDFAQLQFFANGRTACRQTIPSPADLYLEILSMSDGKPSHIYPDANNLINDIAQAYNRTIIHFYQLGCRHIQLDDTACGTICDSNVSKRFIQGGVDPLILQNDISLLFKRSVSNLPNDITVSLFLSGGDVVIPEHRANSIIAEVLSTVDVDKFYLPFDPEQQSQLDILQFIPTGKNVVLGLIDAHSPLPENTTTLIDAVAQATKFVPLAKLSVSPRTGFKLSSYASRGLTYEDQWRKLAQLRNIFSTDI